MVLLNRIYTRSGDQGRTRLATGEEVAKTDARVEAYGAVDELNAVLGLCRAVVGDGDADLAARLDRVQNELFDLGADLATPERAGAPALAGALRILDAQVEALERDIDAANAELQPLTSFVLPAGGELAARLHLARTVCRRAERRALALSGQPGEAVSGPALRYLNRLSDLLFVLARRAAVAAGGETLWKPGGTR